MQTTLKNLGIVRPAPRPGTSDARRQTDWSLLTNDNLKFALDTLSLHQSPYEVDAMKEIQKRIEAGTWLDLGAAPPLIHNVPKWLEMFPFSLLWHQKRGF